MRLPIIGLLGMILVLASEVSADTQDDQARIQFEQGIKLFEDGKHEQAAIAFERAYELKPSYKILYNIGQTQNELGHYAAALEAYTRYLAEGGAEIDAERVAVVKGHIKRLNALVGVVTVETEVRGAVVYVDDVRQGETPLEAPVFVDLGKHTVVVKQGAEELHREIVKVAGSQKVTVRVAAEVEETAEEATAGQAPATVIEEDGGGKRIWTWVAFGVGGAALIGAGITGGVAASKKGTLDENCTNKQCPETEQDTLDSMKALATTTDVLIGVAAVGIAAGIVLFFVEPGLGNEEPAVAVAPAVTAHGGGVSIGGRF